MLARALATDGDSRAVCFDDDTGRGCSSCEVFLTRWTRIAIAGALVDTEAFLLVLGFAKRVGKVPLKFGERRRGVAKD